MTSDITVDLSSGVLSITFTRPQKKNAITNQMYRVLADAMERAESDRHVRVVLFQSTGDSFTAGNDLQEFAAMSAGTQSGTLHGTRFIRALATATVPLVAAVQGRAVGIGTTLLLHCDYVLVAENATLTTPFVNLALVPEAASSLLLPQRIGYVRAFEMFALGEPLDATSAVAYGVANRVVSMHDLATEARGIADKLAAQPAGALRATKQLMRDAETLSARTESEMRIFRERLRSAEAREAFAAFGEKRQPDFTKFA